MRLQGAIAVIYVTVCACWIVQGVIERAQVGAEMLGPISEADAVLLSGDLSSMTSATDPMELRLVRLAVHYRQRSLMAENALDSVVMADGMAGEHCERDAAIAFARRVLGYYDAGGERPATETEIAMHARIAELEAALRPFASLKINASVDGVAATVRMRLADVVEAKRVAHRGAEFEARPSAGSST